MDREAIKSALKAKYPDMPEPGTAPWTEFLRKLKESAPEDYRSALLLGGGVTQALQKEIQRAQRRDALRNLFTRFFLRDHPTGKVPDKRKIGLLIFLLVGGLFSAAFFLGNSPKKEARGGGLGAGVVSGLASSGNSSGSSIPKVSVSPQEVPGNTSEPVSSSSTSEAPSPGSSSLGSSTSGSSATPFPSTGSPTQGEGMGNVGQQNTLGNLPPPPPPVYGGVAGGTVPPPPDASLSTQGAQVVGPPPMVLYANPGMPTGTASSPPGFAGSTPPPSGPSEPGVSSSQGSGNTGEMAVFQTPPGGMLVVQSAPASGMQVVSETPSPSGVGETPTSPVPMGPMGPQFPQGGGK